MVETHKIEIEKILEENREEIEAARLVVYMIYECHLLWEMSVDMFGERLR